MARKPGDPPEDYGGKNSEDKSMLNDIKAGVEGDEDIPIPDIGSESVSEEIAPPVQSHLEDLPQTEPMGAPPSGVDITQKIHEISEAIVNEKWEEFMGRVGDLATWQERVNMNISALKQELIRTQGRFENLQRAVLGKIGDYDKGITEIHTEMKALEKVFERILDPLVSNVKELGRITEKLKK